MEPLGLGALFEGHVDGTAQAAEELDDRLRFGRHDGTGDHAPAVLAHRGHGACLMHIEGDIFRAPLHESRSLLWGG